MVNTAIAVTAKQKLFDESFLNELLTKIIRNMTNIRQNNIIERYHLLKEMTLIVFNIASSYVLNITKPINKQMRLN